VLVYRHGGRTSPEADGDTVHECRESDTEKKGRKREKRKELFCCCLPHTPPRKRKNGDRSVAPFSVFTPQSHLSPSPFSRCPPRNVAVRRYTTTSSPVLESTRNMLPRPPSSSVVLTLSKYASHSLPSAQGHSTHTWRAVRQPRARQAGGAQCVSHVRGRPAARSTSRSIARVTFGFGHGAEGTGGRICL